MLHVRFIGEEAVDEGGPRREFFHLLLQEIFKSSYFVGFPANVVPVHNIEAVVKNINFIIGKMLSTSIIQGGEAPAYFARPVADYLVFNRVESAVNLDDISDFEIRDSLRRVS